MIIERRGKRVLCRCDLCGSEVMKYLSQLTNLTYQFCNQTCSTQAKRQGQVIDTQVRNHSLSKRGVEHHLMSDDVKRKRSQTNMALYGTANQFERRSVIEHIAEVVGTRSSEQLAIIEQKRRKTCIRRYGVEHPSQHPDVHNRQVSRSKSSHECGNIETQWGTFWFRSSWERVFLEWCVTHAVTVQPNVHIRYEFDGKQRAYFADFLVTLKNDVFLCEVKPDAMAALPQNQAKFDAAQRWCLNNNARFVHINKEALSNLESVLA